ncbi:ATP-dependent hsl protease ATP-binding subunit HslU [Liberibacter crescens BT-1]|uniref:ATP-dependent hsl protease ATP-binding subunit HslU n=1 Tax=Liberibacter crescens (strain BT-1) TaxID=1215343 RepID=L0EUW4_LIBCB|nr:ATP-dependent protease ATPase subunit HslU [Liberibacter crescens]AGA65339.1 ATP-dependent hsl protease ATP-binding subunit HslU [Liberibacter crescens BT-1]AMC12280.1 ATP-dependent protease [Liberibacter crescens]
MFTINLSPSQIVAELDRYIIGQDEAKRAVAIALRNRWRRQKLPENLRDEVTPKNIMLIGPTGVGKTEISRRLAKLVGAPFIKVEATKFTEVGYVGRDVEQIIRDLVDIGVNLVRQKKRNEIQEKARINAEERILDALVGNTASPATREVFRKKFHDGEIDDREIDVEVSEKASDISSFEIPGLGANVGVLNLSELFSKAMGKRKKRIHATVKECYSELIRDESDQLIDNEATQREAVHIVENNGIVFLDEIDKIVARDSGVGAGVSREGVQRDLLPLIEGSVVSTKYGPVKTDHILFIASGAFHVSKPSDLLPEIQGRFPVQVKLKSLNKDDFRRILIETESNLIIQYKSLMKTEGLDVDFTDDSIEAIADMAVDLNTTIENIGARRLQTLMERVFDDIAFTASERAGTKVIVDAKYVMIQVGDLSSKVDLYHYIL